MKFSEVTVHDYFRLPGVHNSLHKTSPFGYTDPENRILGEIQVMGDPIVEELAPPAVTKKAKKIRKIS